MGTTYGGDGQTNFGLPDLRGRLPGHINNSISFGAKDGAETVTLTTSQLPAHTYVANAMSTAGTKSSPTNAV